MSTAATSSSPPAFISVPRFKRWTVDEFHAHFGEPTYSNVNRQLHVFRDPTIDAAQLFGAYYRSRQVLDTSATICTLAPPANPITVNNLMP